VIDALIEQQGRGKRLRQIGDGVGRIGRRSHRALDVLHAEAGVPHDASALDDSSRHPRNARLLAQRFEVALEAANM
jgi:hypothetical protein